MGTLLNVGLRVRHARGLAAVDRIAARTLRELPIRLGGLFLVLHRDGKVSKLRQEGNSSPLSQYLVLKARKKDCAITPSPGRRDSPAHDVVFTCPPKKHEEREDTMLFRTTHVETQIRADTIYPIPLKRAGTPPRLRWHIDIESDYSPGRSWRRSSPGPGSRGRSRSDSPRFSGT